MAKVVISEREVELIKGLVAHKDFNDQQILSIFSYLHRNLNPREIGAIRKGSKPKYQAAKTASEDEVDAILYHYSKIANLADKLGFAEMDQVTKQVHKAVEIMKSAIMVFNNCMISTRSETFIVLSVIAWTYLLHAKFAHLDIKPVYTNEDGSDILTGDGKAKHWELSHCLGRAEANLTAGMKNNLVYIIAVRNEVEHRSFEDINDEVQAKLQATALNFLKYVTDNFGQKFNFSQDLSFAIQLHALTLQSPNILANNRTVSKSVAAVNKLLEAPMSSAEFNDPDYAFRVYVVPKVVNNSKKADQAVSYSPVGSDVEIAIKQVERPKYRRKDAIKLIQDRGLTNVTAHDFTQAWKSAGLKDPGKGLAIELGNQWFWYQEGVDAIYDLLNK